MSDTTQVTLATNIWTDLSGSTKRGLLTNRSSNRVIVVEAASQPTAGDSLGHILNPGEDVNLNLISSQKLWGLSINQSGVVSLTPNAGISKDKYFTEEFWVEVGKGNIPGHSIMSAMGERSSIGTTAAGEDVWRGNELTPAPTSHTLIPTPDSAGEQMTVVSESADDNATGTGARTVEIHYIDAAGGEQVEIVTMNGLTPVDTVATDIRFINDFHVKTAGTGLLPDSYIKIYKKGSAGLVYSMLGAGENKSLVPHRMIPVGKYLLLTFWFATEAKAKRAVYRIRSTDHDGILLPGIFNFKDTCYLNNSTSGQLTVNVKIPALSIIKVTAWADISGAEGSCSWQGILVDA